MLFKWEALRFTGVSQSRRATDANCDQADQQNEILVTLNYPLKGFTPYLICIIAMLPWKPNPTCCLLGMHDHASNLHITRPLRRVAATAITAL